jgi:hypothetical protein
MKKDTPAAAHVRSGHGVGDGGAGVASRPLPSSPSLSPGLSLAAHSCDGGMTMAIHCHGCRNSRKGSSNHKLLLFSKRKKRKLKKYTHDSKRICVTSPVRWEGRC